MAERMAQEIVKKPYYKGNMLRAPAERELMAEVSLRSCCQWLAVHLLLQTTACSSLIPASVALVDRQLALSCFAVVKPETASRCR